MKKKYLKKNAKIEKKKRKNTSQYRSGLFYLWCLI